MKQRITLYVLLAILTLVGSAAYSFADTSVHGFTIPTVSEETTPLRICTTTSTRLWENRGSSDTSAMFCPSPTGARRTVSFEEAVEAAAFLSENINFAFDSATLGPEAHTAILAIAAFLAEDPTATLGLVGHADAVGTELYNLGLSARRAGAASALFAGAGVDVERIVALWVGEQDLLIDTPGPELQNRRVVITLSR